MATFTSTQAGDWNSASTWGDQGVPGAGDDANVGHAVAVPVGVTAEASTLAINNELAAGASVNNAGTGNFGTVTLLSGAALTCNGGTVAVGTLSIDETSHCDITAGALSISTSFSMSSGGTPAFFQSGGTLTMACGNLAGGAGVGATAGRVGLQISGGTVNVPGSAVVGGAGTTDDGSSTTSNGGDAISISGQAAPITVTATTVSGGPGGVGGMTAAGGVGGAGITGAVDANGLTVNATTIIGGNGGGGGTPSGGNAQPGGNGGEAIVVAGSAGALVVAGPAALTGGNGGDGSGSDGNWTGANGGNGGNGLALTGTGSSAVAAGAITGGSSGYDGSESNGYAGGTGGTGGKGWAIDGMGTGTKTATSVTTGTVNSAAGGEPGAGINGSVPMAIAVAGPVAGGSSVAAIQNGFCSATVSGNISGAANNVFKLPATVPAGQVWLWQPSVAPVYTFTGQTCENSGKLIILAAATVGGTIKNKSAAAQAAVQLGNAEVQQYGAGPVTTARGVFAPNIYRHA